MTWRCDEIQSSNKSFAPNFIRAWVRYTWEESVGQTFTLSQIKYEIIEFFRCN
jgi:hypothetical protein